MELGPKLKDARVRAGLSQEQLAKQLGVTRQTVSNWENCRSYPDAGSLVALSELYGISLDAMLKSDQEAQNPIEAVTAKRRNQCQDALETSLVLLLLGWLLTGQNFTFLGRLLSIIGIVSTYGSIVLHLRFFDHTASEIKQGIAGLALQLLLTILGLTMPDISTMLLTVIRLAATVLIYSAGVWRINWKSTRLWLIIVLYVGTPFFTMATHLQDTGSLDEHTPFPGEYRVAQVLYPEDTSGYETRKVNLQLILSEHRLQLSDNGADYETIGIFTYIPAVPERGETAVWQLIPEESPQQMYKVMVDENDQVILSFYEDEQLHSKWLLSRIDTAGIVVATFGKTMTTSPNWYLAGITDPKPYFGKSDVLKNAKMTITVGGLDTEELTLIEEYHYGDQVESQTYTLQPESPGRFFLKLTTRYKDPQQWALYRIPFQGGEYRFTLTFE